MSESVITRFSPPRCGRAWCDGGGEYEKLQTYVRPGKTEGMKLETVTHSVLWKNDALLGWRKANCSAEYVDPANLKMFVRVKSVAIPSATKAAETKVRAALDSARRTERERAALNNLSVANPDNCDEL